MEIQLILIIAGLLGFLGAFFTFHGKRQRDVGLHVSHPEFSTLVDSCRSEILIVTDLDPTTFNKDDILEHLSRAKSRGCEIKLIFDSRANLEDAPKLAELEKKGILKIKKYGQPLDVHFVVVDGQNIRLDHHPFQQYQAKNAEGRVLFRTLELGRKYRRRFDHMWAE